jgi:hypothetical protein
VLWDYHSQQITIQSHTSVALSRGSQRGISSFNSKYSENRRETKVSKSEDKQRAFSLWQYRLTIRLLGNEKLSPMLTETSLCDRVISAAYCHLSANHVRYFPRQTWRPNLYLAMGVFYISNYSIPPARITRNSSDLSS